MQERDAHFDIRFATAKSQCLVMQWPSTSNEPHDAACPDANTSVTTSAASGSETMLAYESVTRSASRLVLGIVTYDMPHADFGFASAGREQVVERPFRGPRGAGVGSQASPDLVPIGGQRFLLVWVEGGVEGHQVRAQSVAGWGDSVGPAIDLSTPDVSVIGRPTAAVAPNGDGLVAYIASAGEEFDLFGTPISCSTP
ncbi:MAG TPA: hypothetical protein VN894_04755 [Polyangiaceae bacterium]|nr:hypothetical protein [Polyangiaceae bacterium]